MSLALKVGNAEVFRRDTTFENGALFMRDGERFSLWLSVTHRSGWPILCGDMG
jgi:hypothetical protein